LHIVPTILGVGAWRMGPISPLRSPAVHLVGDIVFYTIALAVFGGLWFFRRWARVTYVIVTALVVVACLARPQAIIGSTTFIGFFMLESVLDGAIISLSYFGLVREQFTRKA